MPTPTYDLITSNTLTSAASSITFSSLNTLAAGYRDLILVMNLLGGSGDFYPRVRYNGVTSTVYAWVNAYGGGGGVYGSNNGNENGQQLANNQFAPSGGHALPIIVQLMDFSATDKTKTMLTKLGRANNGVEMVAGRAAINGAITSIELYSSNGSTLASGSSVFMYGIKAA